MCGQHFLVGECLPSLPAHLLFLFRDTAQAPHPCWLSLRWRWLLLTRQRAPLQIGQTPLHLAAFDGKEGVIKALLEAGADPAAKDKVRGQRDGGSGRAEGRKGGGRYAGRGRWLVLAGRCRDAGGS